MTLSPAQNYSNVEIEGKVAMYRRLQFHSLGLILPFADSTVLAYVMKILNDRYNYGLDLYLLSIESATGPILESLVTS